MPDVLSKYYRHWAKNAAQSVKDLQPGGLIDHMRVKFGNEPLTDEQRASKIKYYEGMAAMYTAKADALGLPNES